MLWFHAVYWPALLLSAGVPLPTEILVHDYLTVEGRKLSKSHGNVIDPVALAERFGTDAVRWWLLREVPRVGDADFTVERLAARSDEDLANGLGNLVNRVVSMVHRYRDGQLPDERPAPAKADGTRCRRSTSSARSATPLSVTTSALTRRSPGAGWRSTSPRASRRSTIPVMLEASQCSLRARSRLGCGRPGSSTGRAWAR